MKRGLLIGLVLLACMAFAQTDEERLTQYASQLKKVNTLQSHFTEEKHLSLLNAPLTSTGQLAFDKQAQTLHWYYQTPFQNGFLIEKNQVYRLQGNTKQPVQNAMGRMMAVQLVRWLTLDFEELKKEYEITLNTPQITFVPRNKAHQVVRQITVWLDEQNPQLVHQVRMEQPGGDFIVWKFSNVHINEPLAGEGA